MRLTRDDFRPRHWTKKNGWRYIKEGRPTNYPERVDPRYLLWLEIVEPDLKEKRELLLANLATVFEIQNKTEFQQKFSYSYTGKAYRSTKVFFQGLLIGRLNYLCHEDAPRYPYDLVFQPVTQ
jgi:hypothetical protein